MLVSLALLASTLAPLYAPDSEFVLAAPLNVEGEPVAVVVDGWKRSSCDEVLAPKLTVRASEHVLAIEVRALPGTGLCQPVMTRFTAVVDAGALAAGRWLVLVNGAPMEAGLEVGEGGARDEDLAAVTAVDVENAPGGGWNAVISGELASSCERLYEARVATGLRAYDVTPAVAHRDGDDCAAGRFAFTTRVALPDPAAAGRYLVRVRGRGTDASTVFGVGDLDVIGKDGH